MASVASPSTLSQDTSVQPVMFRAGGPTLAGNLYRPAHATAADPRPGIVVTGTWTSVKEQMADRYAQRLAEHGLVALSFDFTGFGVSGGTPREVESPSVKTGDIGWAAAFLSHHPLVRRDRVGALAICASAGYAAGAATGEGHLRALALVAPWLHDARILPQVYGGEEGVRARMQAGERARRRYVETGVVEYVPVVDADDPRAAMPAEVDFYRDPARGAVPGWPNRFAVMAWTEWLRFDPIALAPRVTAPTLIVHSEQAAIPDGARRFHRALTCPKDIVWTTGTQFDFYDRDPQVGFAVARAVEHFRRHL